MTDFKNVVSFPDLKAIEEQAALWVARMDSRDLSASEKNEFRGWLKQSPQHAEAVERMAALWDGSDILDQLNYLDDEIPHSRPFLTRYFWAVTAVAATILLMVGIAALQMMPSFPATQAGQYTTAVGDVETITLVDGSSITLNTNSLVEVDLGETTREVRLVRGEAHFKVAHDTSRPFLVYAGGGVVKAVGTAFSVHLRHKEIEVTVDEGIVEYLAPSDPLPSDMLEGVRMPLASLLPVAALTVGQNAVFTEKVERIEKMSQQTLDRKLLWKDGFIAFAGEPLSRVVADISRYTEIEIAITDPTLENTPIGGYFRVGDVDGMFEALENVFGVQVNRISPTQVTLTRAS